ncbi:MAG: GNAT family N-acetyltransferase [Nitrospiraceae bacterium]|nr:GNAT family N-acetyltransferase [Nitrospiraceae bacterium]
MKSDSIQFMVAYDMGMSSMKCRRTVMTAVIPRRIPGDIVSLRPMRIFDSLFVRSMFGDEDVLQASGLDGPPGCTSLFLWWWMRKTFRPAWCIVHGGRTVGFIGLCSLCLGQSAEMTLVITDSRDRRRGYGTAAFMLVASALSSSHAVERIFVRTGEDNGAAVSFWRKLGFREEAQSGGIRMLSLEMKNFDPEGRSPVL